MKFEYIEYHKSVSDEELLCDLRSTANKLKTSSLLMKEYDKNGRYSSSAISRRFGTWKKALSLAGLEYRKVIYYKRIK